MLNGNIILHTDSSEIGNKDSQMNLNYITIDCMEYMCVGPIFYTPEFFTFHYKYENNRQYFNQREHIRYIPSSDSKTFNSPEGIT